MTNKKITTALKKYQKTAQANKSRGFLLFEKKMLYRTTKTENPNTTMRMVNKVLSRVRRKVS